MGKTIVMSVDRELHNRVLELQRDLERRLRIKVSMREATRLIGLQEGQRRRAMQKMMKRRRL
jgi:argonaute-like protein implicated in RNA metabolism and viral defense